MNDSEEWADALRNQPEPDHDRPEDVLDPEELGNYYAAIGRRWR